MKAERTRTPCFGNRSEKDGAATHDLKTSPRGREQKGKTKGEPIEKRLHFLANVTGKYKKSAGGVTGET